MLLAHLRGRRAAFSTTAAFALVCFAAAPAWAGQPPDPSGNNGNLKVHLPSKPFDSTQQDAEEVRNFYLAGFGFDDNQTITYVFTYQGDPDSGQEDGTGGTFTVGPDNNFDEGDGRTPVLNAVAIGLDRGTDVHRHRDDERRLEEEAAPRRGGLVAPATPPPTPPPGGEEPGGEEPGEVDNEGASDDDGVSPVGGVDTGGDPAASSTGATTPLLVGLGAVALAGVALRRRQS